VSEHQDVDAAVARIEELVARLGEADPSLARTSEDLIRELMALYGAAFARILEVLGPDATAGLAEDKLVASLLLLHGLHPVPAETRVAEALGRVERRLDGARLSIAEISDGRLRVRVECPGGALPPSASMIERAVTAAAPEIAAVEIEGLPQPSVPLVQIAPTAIR
jgi:fermentation-respiration switch protein FrsA (DUF1100 family)